MKNKIYFVLLAIFFTCGTNIGMAKTPSVIDPVDFTPNLYPLPPTPIITVLESSSERMAPHTVFVHGTDSDLNGGSWEKDKFEWDFDVYNLEEGNYLTTTDPRTGTSVNLAKDQQGFNVAYVYQNPGTYTIRLKITNELGEVGIDEVYIVVDGDLRQVRHVDVSALDGGDGSQEYPWNDLGFAVSQLQDNMTLLLKSGQTLNFDSTINFGSLKNVIIKSDGKDKANLLWTGNPNSGGSSSIESIQFASSENVILRNLRFENSYGLSDSNNNVRAIEMGSGFNSVTIWDLEFEGEEGEVNGFSRWISGTSGPQAVLVLNSVGGRAIKHHFSFMGSKDISIIGSKAGASLSEHIFRANRGSGLNKRINLAWNVFDYEDVQGQGKGAVRYQEVQWGSLFRNKLLDGQLEIGHDGGDVDYVVVNSNLITDGTVSFAALVFKDNSKNVLIKNNVFEVRDRRAIFVTSKGTFRDYGLENLEVIGNTFRLDGIDQNAIIISDDNSDGKLVRITNVLISNNLFLFESLANGRIVLQLDSLGNGDLVKVENNVYPEVVNELSVFAKFNGANYNWAEWGALSLTSNEALETVVLSDVVEPFYRPPTYYSVATSNAKPVAGVFNDYLNVARPMEDNWYAGAVDSICPLVDFNGDGFTTSQDFIYFLNAFRAGNPQADWNGDRVINTQDFLVYMNDFVECSQ